MALSQLVEKLKFGEKFILANIVIVPLGKSLDSNASEECELPARNKFLTCDVWQSFVYRKLYDLFRKNFIENGNDMDPLYALNKEYHINCAERPYLQMKYTFRDKAYRNNLNILFKEKAANLYDSCIYVEISDIGRAIFDKVDDRDRTILRLLKEVSDLKRESLKIASDTKKVTFPSSKGSTPGVEEYHPEPVRRSARNSDEEYVPVTRNGVSPGIKRIYKPSKIVDGHKPVSPSEHDPYTPETVKLPVKISYTPSKSSPNRTELQRQSAPRATKTEKTLFGSDDDEEYDPAASKASPEHQAKNNDSEKDMFSDSDQYTPSGITPSNEEIGLNGNSATSCSAKREILPRSSKKLAHGLMAESPEEIEKRKAKTDKKIAPSSKGEESLKTLLNLKKGIRRKAASKGEGSLGKLRKIETITEVVATKVKQNPNPDMLDCTSLSQAEILGTFEQYKDELHGIFLKYKDKTERQWISSNELCYYTDVGNILTEEQKIAMLELLEDKFVPQQQRGKYTEFFTSSLLMEWGLRLFMERHKFTSRDLALECIKKQEKSYYESLAMSPL